MSLKEKLSPENWKEVVKAPFLAGFAVSAADPNGLIGAFQESAALVKSLKSTDDSIGRELIQALEDPSQRREIQTAIKEIAKGRTPAEASKLAVARLSDIMGFVSHSAPEKYDELSTLIRRVSRSVAEAAKEGGFLGIGGVAVSDDEKQSLDDINDAIARS